MHASQVVEPSQSLQSYLPGLTASLSGACQTPAKSTPGVRQAGTLPNSQFHSPGLSSLSYVSSATLLALGRATKCKAGFRLYYFLRERVHAASLFLRINSTTEPLT